MKQKLRLLLHARWNLFRERIAGTSAASDEKTETPLIAFVGKSINRIPYPLFLSLAAVLAFIVVIYFFCPRFTLWKGLGLDTPISYSNPEVNRALATLKKTDTPFAFVTYPGKENHTINWRLLFPLLGHYLHLPRFVFLALPHLGCLMVFGFIAHLACKSTGRRLLSFGTVILMGTTSWFFVSTGWLAYFDSWYLLGLLLASFAISRRALFISCFLAPWVDERFVITLPLSILIRVIYLRWLGLEKVRQYIQDILIIIAGVAPYALIRLFLVLGGQDPYSAGYVTVHNSLWNATFWQATESIWAGLRGAWFFVVIFVLLSFRQRRAWFIPAVLLILAGTMLVLITVAGDYGRNMSAFIPAAVMGLLLLHRAKPNWLADIVIVLLAFNLLTPAIHGFDRWRMPISNLYTEIERYKNPPDYLNPDTYNKLAVELVERGDMTSATNCLNLALRLDSKHPQTLYNRSLARQRLGDTTGAIADLENALRYSPKNWPLRSQAEQSLASIRQHL